MQQVDPTILTDQFIEHSDGRVELVKLQDENFLPVESPYPEGEFISGCHDEPTHDECGIPLSGFYAASTKSWKLSRWRCHSQACPVCFRSWAAASADRLAGNLWAMYTSGVTGDLYHCVISPDPRLPFPGWDALFENIRKFFKQLHASPAELGYVQVPHVDRIKCGTCGDTPVERGLAGSKLGMCQHIDPDTGIPCNAVNWVRYYSPHVHFVTNFQFANESYMRELQHVYGFWFSNISRDNRVKGKPGRILSREVLYAILNYELGHAKYVPGKILHIEKDDGTFVDKEARATPAFKMLGLFHYKRWAKNTSVPDFTVEVPLDAMGEPYYKVVGEGSGNMFTPKRDANGVPVFEEIDVENWVEDGIECRRITTRSRTYLELKHYNPVLRLYSDKNGVKINYPDDGCVWKQCSGDEFYEDENWNGNSPPCDMRLHDEDYDFKVNSIFGMMDRRQKRHNPKKFRGKKDPNEAFNMDKFDDVLHLGKLMRREQFNGQWWAEFGQYL